MRIAQLNTNHSRGAQDLLLQWAREHKTALIYIAEPHSIPRSPLWLSDLGNTAAIYWSPQYCPSEVTLLESGDGYVAARVDNLRVYSVYFSPNERRDAFEERLERLAESVRRTGPSPVLVVGDFNASSVIWGSRSTSPRDESVEEWAALLDLTILNRGAVPTCIRAQGSSIVDLSWGSANLVSKVVSWRVASTTETLSDHALIWIKVEQRNPCVWGSGGGGDSFPSLVPKKYGSWFACGGHRWTGFVHIRRTVMRKVRLSPYRAYLRAPVMLLLHDAGSEVTNSQTNVLVEQRTGGAAPSLHQVSK